MTSFIMKALMSMVFYFLISASSFAKVPGVFNQVYLPDYSYAGYEFGEKQPNIKEWRVINVAEHGLIANDGLDDTQALQALLKRLQNDPEPVVIQFGLGRYQISDIIRISRSHLVIRGAGKSATEFYFPRPLMYATTPSEMKELALYLDQEKKIERNSSQNIKLPYTLWSWSGGFFWTAVEGARVKAYLHDYSPTEPVLANILSGKKDSFIFTVDNPSQLKVGHVVEINWHNPEGKNGSFLQQLYGDSNVKLGSRHWENPELALSRQQVLITDIKANTITIKTPLLHDIDTRWNVNIRQWQHIEQVGFEHFTMRFDEHQHVAHHVESGYNGIYLTRTFNSWIKDITIENSDSAVLTESIANVTIADVTTTGKSLAHYTVQLGGVHNVLVKGLTIENPSIHPLSFNTFANKNVYLDSDVKVQPVLDQHSGANHHNLFDNTRVHITLNETQGQYKYPLFLGGGASYWKPSHGNHTTLWNTRINFTNGALSDQPIVLYGMKDGPNARLIGVSANLPFKIEYGPNSYQEGIGEYFSDIPSLYIYQLQKRLSKLKSR
ncbi:hypothetical protein RC083_21695 [Pseudoalteromonas haloplanktis]|uniref:Pectate lyase superfamily protein domain-containing protein n=1 Tax=Pseudoalteromonas haloplanktis TaxID=228 RepID=A0ABU1BIN5_PSEHA|nr:hypothetical protein [Pseudoalteromonas haloplanktis]MDQ9094177.1 hypothetical protein [Pseudoalteromonas haloplanktis]